MATAIGTYRPLLGAVSPAQQPIRRSLWRRFPYESAALFVVSFFIYIVAAVYVVLHLHHMDGDAYSRVAQASYVLFSRDKHLAAIGFIWPPLPTLLDIPTLLFKPWFSELATRGFAGSIEAAAFTAGTVVVLNGAYRRAGLVFPLRLLLALAWIANPMTALYGTMGMSEAMFDFFVVASLLKFYKWNLERVSADLTYAGILAGLGILVRWEMLFVAAILGIGVGLCSLRAGKSWRETECNLLLYGLPAVFCLTMWIGATAVIEHDALFVFHSAYAVGQVGATHGFGVDTMPYLKTWRGATDYILHEAFSLYPVVVPLAGLLVARLIYMRGRVAPLVVLVLAIPVFAFDIYSLKGGTLALVIRYQIYVIPYAFVLVAVLLADVGHRSRLGAQVMGLAAFAMLAASNLVTLQTMAKPDMAPSEAPIVARALANQPTDVATSGPSLLGGSYVANRVAELDREHGLVLVDTFRANPIILNAPDPELYVITSDEDFERSVAAPVIFHIKYILVPAPGTEGLLDYINRQYPDLWRDGAGIATLVEDIGTADGWRLYRVNGS